MEGIGRGRKSLNQWSQDISEHVSSKIQKGLARICQDSGLAKAACQVIEAVQLRQDLSDPPGWIGWLLPISTSPPPACHVPTLTPSPPDLLLGLMTLRPPRLRNPTIHPRSLQAATDLCSLLELRFLEDPPPSVPPHRQIRMQSSPGVHTPHQPGLTCLRTRTPHPLLEGVVPVLLHTTRSGATSGPQSHRPSIIQFGGVWHSADSHTPPLLCCQAQSGAGSVLIFSHLCQAPRCCRDSPAPFLPCSLPPLLPSSPAPFLPCSLPPLLPSSSAPRPGSGSATVSRGNWRTRLASTLLPGHGARERVLGHVLRISSCKHRLTIPGPIWKRSSHREQCDACHGLATWQALWHSGATGLPGLAEYGCLLATNK
ncbi:unnamed protein product [Pleuronectes platessa]|uniref:Uncharacterized protein n=1 Tax=Pleuronectes platessa TaxID=8262 RepID=A0A9N7UIS5_PLEPL|nr:unnamed protein product [Pleuronectes platessa]